MAPSCALAEADPEDAALSRYALDTLAVVALTGTIDRITDGARGADRERSRPRA
jgi:chromosome segregation and condensation protein ScpB